MPRSKRNPIAVAWIKVYNAEGVYRASCVDYTDAAILCASYGPGSEARNGHTKKRAIWREGFEEKLAAESYDFAALTMIERMTSQLEPMQID